MSRPRVPEVPQREPLLSANAGAALGRLRRRLAEVEALKAFVEHPDDPRFDNAERNIIDDIREIFGEGSTEHSRHEGHQIWMEQPDSFGLSEHEYKRSRQIARKQGIDATKVVLEGLIARAEERAGEAAIDGVRDARAVFGQLLIHPRILAACSKQFADRHYRDAILAAGIALVEYVRERSGSALDGTNLMMTVFSARQPTLAFNAAQTQTDQDEQQGMMHLFAGAVLALRNPRAHSLSPDTADYALEAITLISFLAKQLDTARKL